MTKAWCARNALSWLFVLLLGAAAGTACSSGGGTGSAPAVKLAFVTNNASEFWKIAAAGVRKYEDLPSEARAYVARIEEITGVPAAVLSTGSAREDTIIRDGSVAAGWFGL